MRDSAVRFQRAESPAERTSAPLVPDRQERPGSHVESHVDADGVLEHTALESRASVDNLEALQDRRRQLVKQYAPLAARFRGGAIAGSDAARKRHRALVARRILIELEQKGEKAPSEAALERMANADTEHIAFCDALERDFTRYILLENDIADVNEQIRNREECLRVYRAELNLSM